DRAAAKFTNSDHRHARVGMKWQERKTLAWVYYVIAHFSPLADLLRAQSLHAGHVEGKMPKPVEDRLTAIELDAPQNMVVVPEDHIRAGIDGQVAKPPLILRNGRRLGRFAPVKTGNDDVGLRPRSLDCTRERSFIFGKWKCHDLRPASGLNPRIPI